ncbi:unnamed protein product, partial [Didymodactylos carnosus]
KRKLQSIHLQTDIRSFPQGGTLERVSQLIHQGRLDETLSSSQPATFILGTNNLTVEQPTAAIEKVKNLVHIMKKNDSTCNLNFVLVPPRRFESILDDVNIADSVKMFNDDLQQLSSQLNFKTIDLGISLEYVSRRDGIHLTPEGVNKITKTLIRTLKSKILHYCVSHTGLMSKNYQDEQTDDEDAKAYKRLCSKHRQVKRRQRLTSLFCPDASTLTDSSVICTQAFTFSDEEDNNNYNTSTDSPTLYSQNFLFFDEENNNDTNHTDNGILTANVEFENCYDDKKSQNFDTDFIVDSMFDIHDTEPKIELEIAKYICQANLDKTKTNHLLTLLNHVHDQRQLPPSSSIDLWDKLNIKFEYTKIEYCTSCTLEINGSSCLCNSTNKQISSELIIFPTVKEIERIVNNNYDLMLNYKLQKDDNLDDIVLARIVEVPRPFRNNEQNTILLCLWHSPRAPTANQLLGRIVEDISRLLESGIYININGLGYVHFDLYVQGVCADGPGQSKITQIVAHNGYYACRVCELQGIYSARDKTCTYSWSSFVHTNPRFRTRDRFELCLKKVERLFNMGNTDINVYGIKGISPLNQLIFLPTQSIYDYFHLCLEIVIMFSSESCLHGLYKLAHGTKHLGEQIAYWYTIHRAIHSMSIKNQPGIIHNGCLIDGYIDEFIIQKYQQQFDNAFFLKFFCSPDRALRSKCFFLSFHDARFIVCTPIDNELEHD